MYYKRFLPHWQPEGAALFVTWRLHGSLPKHCLNEKASPGERFAATDQLVDAGTVGPLWLADDRIAGLVADAFRFGERELGLYELGPWVIMPNHVHIVVVPNVPLSRITGSLKGYTGRMANRILGRSNQPFWHHESYDHWVRNRYELGKIVRYIEQNPVRAGLAESPESYTWSSLFVLEKTRLEPCAT